MKKKRFIIAITIIIISISLFYFFTKNNYKTLKFGNTTIKSTENIKEYILNLESYEAQIAVEIHSNKNKNQYKMKQIYQAPNRAIQEILEPVAIKGLITSYDGNNLTIENTKLQLNKIYENYPYVAENHLWLSSFIKDYKDSQNATSKEEKNQVILQITTKQQDKKEVTKTLYVDKKTSKPTKLTIEDMNQKMKVYILYNEIKINSSR